MSIFSRISNAIRAPQARVKGSSAMQAASQPRPIISVPRAGSRAEIGDSAPAPIKTTVVPPELLPGADPWVVKFTGPDYFPQGPISDGKRWLDRPEKFTPQLAEFVLSKAGGSLSADERAHAAKIAIDWQFLEGEIVRHAWSGATTLFLSQADEVRRGLETGRAANVSAMTSREELYERCVTVRAQCRQVQARLSGELYAILKPFCERTRDAARQLVEQTAAEERAALDVLGMEWIASRKLRSLIWFAVAGWSVPIDNYLPNFASLRPWSDWFGIELWVMPAEMTAPAKTDLQERMETVLADHQRMIDMESTRAKKRRDIDEAEHAAAVTEVSSKNDEFREAYNRFRLQHETTGRSELQLPSDEEKPAGEGAGE